MSIGGYRRGGLSVRGPGLNAKSNGKLGEVGAHPVDRRLHGVHPPVQPLLQPVHALIYRVEPMIDPIEPLIDPVEPAPQLPSDRIELTRSDPGADQPDHREDRGADDGGGHFHGDGPSPGEERCAFVRRVAGGTYKLRGLSGQVSCLSFPSPPVAAPSRVRPVLARNARWWARRGTARRGSGSARAPGQGAASSRPSTWRPLRSAASMSPTERPGTAVRFEHEDLASFG